MGETNEKQIMFYKNKIYNQLNELESLGYINGKEKQSMIEITSLCYDYEQLKEMSDLSLQKKYAEYFRNISGSNMTEVIKESLPEQIEETKDIENTDEQQYDESNNIYESELDRTAAALSLLKRLDDKEKYGFDPEALDIDDYDSEDANQDGDYFDDNDEYTEEEDDIDSYFEDDEQYDDNNFEETEGINGEITDSENESYDYDSDYYNQYEDYSDTEDSENGEISENELDDTSENCYDDYFLDDDEVEENNDDSNDGYYSDDDDYNNDYNWSTDEVFNSDADGSLSDDDFIAEDESGNNSEWFTESGYEDSYFDDNDDDSEPDDDYFTDDEEPEEPEEPEDDYFSDDDEEPEEPEESDDSYFSDDDEPEEPDDDYFGDDEEPEEPEDDYFSDDDEPEDDYFNDDDDDDDSYFDEDDEESESYGGLMDSDYYDYETDEIDEGITENDVDIDGGSWFNGSNRNTLSKTKEEPKREKTFTKGEHAKETQAMFDNLGKTIKLGVRLIDKARKQSSKF